MVRIYQVDAFAEAAFSGNPAGVCLLEESVSSDWMQSVAREMNLSETAFVVERGREFGLRWFTPAQEVELCGHATLASAHILWEAGGRPVDEILKFHTLSGLLTAESVQGRTVLDFPAQPIEAAPPPDGLIDALGVRSLFIGKNKTDYLVELASEAEIRNLHPDFRRLAGIACRGIIVTSRSESPDYDFVSRFFAPAAGVDEDPVTGSAHCALAPFWMARLNRNPMKGCQLSARGGSVGVEVRGDRVRLEGKSITVLSGELLA